MWPSSIPHGNHDGHDRHDGHERGCLFHAPLHPRAVIRQQACALLEQLFPGPVFASRVEAWEQEQLPAAAVYTVEEEPLPSDIARRPDDRSLTLVVDMLCASGPRLDDSMDALSLIAESVLHFESLCSAVGQLVLLDMRHAGTSMAEAETGDRLIGLATVTWTVEYRMPQRPGSMHVFATGFVDWDLGDHAVGGGEGPDGRPEAQDMYHMPQETKEDPPHD